MLINWQDNSWPRDTTDHIILLLKSLCACSCDLSLQQNEELFGHVHLDIQLIFHQAKARTGSYSTFHQNTRRATTFRQSMLCPRHTAAQWMSPRPALSVTSPLSSAPESSNVKLSNLSAWHAHMLGVNPKLF